MHAFSRARTVAIALLLPLTAAVTATAVQPAQAVPSPLLVKTLLTDMDGDRTYDTVQLFDLGSDNFRLTVTTTKGVTSSVEYVSQFDPTRPWDWPATKALYGAAPIDGARGSELIVPLYVLDGADYPSESVDLLVFTWRSGKLVTEKAPAAPKLKTWHFGEGYSPTQGYRFFDSHGRRYVDVSDLKVKQNPTRWDGKITRSLWKKGAWVKVSTRTVSLKGSKAYPYLRYDGPSVLLGIASVDVDGNGKADEVRSYRYRDGLDGRYKVKVTTDTGKVVSKRLAADTYDPMVGAAELDGAAGAEIIYHTYGDDQAWTVYIWRKNTLVTEPAPALCGEPPGGRWRGCSDESGIQFTFSTQNDGSRHVVAASFSNEDSQVDTSFDESVWQNGKWVLVRHWTQLLSHDEWENLRTGFFGVPIVKP